MKAKIIFFLSNTITQQLVSGTKACFGQVTSHLSLFNKSMSMNCIHVRRLNRGNFYFSNKRFQILWLISGMEVIKIQTFISVTLNLCILKYTETWGVNTTIHN